MNLLFRPNPTRASTGDGQLMPAKGKTVWSRRGCNAEKRLIGLLENKTEELIATHCHHQYECAVNRLEEV